MINDQVIFLDNKDFICERQVLLTSFHSGGSKGSEMKGHKNLAEDKALGQCIV